MNLIAIRNAADALSTTPALVTVYNDTGLPLAKALGGLLARGLKRANAVGLTLAHDYLEARAGRTGRGRAEVEVYEDGSGLEVAAFGYVLILGIERKGWSLAQEARPGPSGTVC